MTVADSAQTPKRANPFLSLNLETALESLGEDYYDIVPAAEFPQQILRFRNDELLQKLGLEPSTVTDEDFIEAFGYFQGVRPFLALRYHGYQFGEYNPNLGDGRGFVYAQVRGTDGKLYDFGTKGSGRTPYSRHADGRLTLKGGVREVLAAEMLHRMGVRTSRCFSLVETGEQLWRGDEPSPTRSSVMIRFSESHIRFGTFERLHYLGRKDLIEKLLDWVIAHYYPHLNDTLPPLTSEGTGNPKEKYARFYQELVQRVATLTAQWMAAGFCHAVLNTDNMSITGESFDYGPFAFIPTYNLKFTAAYFDYYGRYSYGNQPAICRWNLQMLQVPLKAVINEADMEAALEEYYDHYNREYRQLMLSKLGFGAEMPEEAGTELVQLTLQLLAESQVEYPEFFWQLRQQFSPEWRENCDCIFGPMETDSELFASWQRAYFHLLQFVGTADLEGMRERMAKYNPQTVILRPKIEAVWEPIAQEDNWQPFYELLDQIKRD
ncbi:YdiU family protein [Oscillatoria sp. HE19RPO]|uniref:protein adenylyltransferase SelO n=1 Tax=Oscillatoria sp. HE19RPO TaxID=2954806 RepID=UPI0020C29263|nr:YdiU family protein [Oscillatoria sp. HE19RPO]